MKTLSQFIEQSHRVILDPRLPWPFNPPRKVKAPSKAQQLRELLANVPKAPF